MRKTKVALKGAHRYWFHEGLVAILQRRTNWDQQRIKEFLQRNEVVYFDNLEPSSVTQLLDELKAKGFSQKLEEGKRELKVTIELPYEAELREIKKEFSLLSSRLSQLEQMTAVAPPTEAPRESSVYQRLLTEQSKEAIKPLAPSKTTPEGKRLPKKSMSESTIGKYWLSRIGIFTLALGIVFFIGYTFQYVGAWGKILVGLATGGLLIGIGNLLASRKNYFRWAMSIIGGGWAIIYFTIFAAYHIPVAQVIFNPYLALACLLLVATGSIGQSLKYKSRALVFFSYFLAFVSISTGEISLHTLLASLLLGVSTIVVTKKLGWSWLALFGLAALYLIHWLWLEPSIYGVTEQFAGEERIAEALLLPWVGDEWRIYPLVTRVKSFLHQAFLILYWILFATIGFFQSKEESRGEIVSFFLLLFNSFIFTASYIHHLHVYYPDFKYLFSLGMGAIFLILSSVERNLNKGLLSDAYLAFAVSLFALTIPMYFDGPWVTYGWAVACPTLAWLGTRHQRLVLQRVGYCLAIFMFGHLFLFDYLEQNVLFRVLMSVRASLLLFVAASISLFCLSAFYQNSRTMNEKEKNIVADSCLIASFTALGCGFLIGGFRAATSPIWIYEGVLLMVLGILKNRPSFRLASAIFVGLAGFRVCMVDWQLELLRMLSDAKVALRLTGTATGIVAVLSAAEWLRRRLKATVIEYWPMPFFSVLGALLLMLFFYDDGISPWVSIIWGISASAFIIAGFKAKERIYRWSGLGLFGFVVLRLFLHDFAKLQTIYRIISFIGLGFVLIIVSLIYNYYSKQLLVSEEGKP